MDFRGMFLDGITKRKRKLVECLSAFDETGIYQIIA
jgi:hypothetical protein